MIKPRSAASYILTVSLIFFFASTAAAGFSLFSQHSRVKDVNGEVLIPLSKVNDGKAHYFSYKDSGKEVKFFIVKSPDNTIRAAFDACDVCFQSKKGYSQSGDFMLCNNCGRRFHASRINVEEGGCNPAPLKRRIVGKNLVIRVADILPGARFF